METITQILDEFAEFPKMARLSRPCMITEKIDGTNASVVITDEGKFLVGSRTRWITPQDDNYGFAKWAYDHKDELMTLGVGRHFGEWWGRGIQRGYNVPDKRFWLFNAGRWVGNREVALKDKQEYTPVCCGVVPILYEGLFETNKIQETLDNLQTYGSVASPAFMNPEGIVVYHIAAGIGFKKTIQHDEMPKSLVK